MSDAEATGFSRLEETERFSGWTISLVQATFESPTAHLRARYLRHPGAVAVVAVDDQRHATLVRQYRPSVGTFVSRSRRYLRRRRRRGRGDPRRRELAEEAGLEARSWSQLATLYNSPGYCDQVTRVFLAPASRTPDRSQWHRRGIHDRRGRRPGRRAGLTPPGTVRDATTMVGLLLGRTGHPLGDSTRAERAALSSGGEEYLSWLAVEKGRARADTGRLPS